jgi:NADP-dependent 3-hydroxy acid dehydrogenase YdfG
VDCDVFINNAWKDFHQVEMFDRIYTEWEFDPTKTIVNINSRSRYGRMDVPDVYCFSKKELFKKADSVDNQRKNCRIINISPGYVYTDMIKHLKIEHALTVKECADIIAWAVRLPQHIEIGELSFWTLK